MSEYFHRGVVVCGNISIKLVLIFLISISSSYGYGQILTFDFDGLAGNETSANSNFNDTDLGVSVITRGTGLTASNNGDRFNATSWATGSIANAVSGDDYMEFTLTPNSGFEFDVTTIVVNIQRSNTGLSAIDLRSSSNSFTTNIDGEKSIADNGNSTQVVTFTVNQAASPSAVIYRVYGYAESTGGSGGFEGSGNDIIVNGSVYPVSTIDPEPSNHVTSFTCSNPTSNTIDLTWIDATGAQTPAGYLILWSTVSFAAITTPTDGTAVADGAGALNVADGVGSATLTGLNSSLQHYIKIFPYTNSGGNIDYKTSPSAPQTSACSTSSPVPELQLVDDGSTDQACGFTMDFGAINLSTMSDLTVTIENTGTFGLTISGLSLAGTQFSFASAPPATSFTIGPGLSQDIFLRYTATAAVGSHTGSLTITSDDSDEGTCLVALEGESFNAPIPIPDNDCGSSWAESYFVYSGGPGVVLDVDLDVFIEHTWRNDLQITLESPDGTLIQLLDGSTGGSANNLEVTFDDESALSLSTTDHVLDGSVDETVMSAGTGLLSAFDGEDPTGTWIIRVCDDAGGDTGSLLDWEPIFTVGAPSPEIQLVDDSSADQACSYTIDFGSNSLSSTSTSTFTIENNGTADLNISALSIAPAGPFTIIAGPSAPFTIAVGSTQAFTVQYAAPGTPTLNTATLTIASDDSDESSCTVLLSGESYDPQPSEHADNFDCSNPTSSSIELDWDDAGGTILPSGYLILWSSVGYNSITDPVDGTAIADGPGALNIAQGIEAAVPSSLDPNTTYFFKIYSYTGSGSSIDYKLNGTIPQSSCTTLDAPCISENFENIPANSGSYLYRTWTGTDGFQWEATNASTNNTISTRAITLRANNDGIQGTLSHPVTQTGGIGTLNFDYKRIFSNNSTLQVWVNGIQQGPDIIVSSLTSTTLSLPINIPGSVDLAIINASTAQDRRVVIDNLSWTCYDGGLCESEIIFSARHPIVGPVGTWVRVNRNTSLSTADFYSLDTIYVAGIGVLEIDVIDADILYFKMPEGLSPGVKTISLIDDSGCEETLTFTIQNEAGSCGALPTGLFISEVFDPASGNEHYVELYNPLSTTVFLNGGGTGITDYSLRLDLDNNPPVTYDITTASLTGGQTLLLEMGEDGVLNCTPGEVTTLSGFNNGGDVIELLLNGSVVDRIVLPNSTGYNRIRQPWVGGPNATYVAGEWFNGTPVGADACSHTSTTTPWNISSHPVDVLSEPCGTATFSLNITGASGQIFVWYENIGGNSSTWTPVTIGGDYSLAGTPLGSQLVVANIQSKEGYQYYCRLTSSGCTQFSHAGRIELAPNTRRFYRSSATGIWTVASNWEFSPNGINGWIAACEYPEWRNADHVLIQNTHNISVNQDLYVPVVEIAVGGVLETLVTTHLEFEETAAGAELIISGTWIDHGDNSNNTLFSNGSTWEISSGGTIVKTNTSSTSTYKDNYETGIANITADAHWYYHHIAADVSTATTSMYYPNLYFSSNSGHNFDGTQELLSGSLTTAEIKGNLTLGSFKPDGTPSSWVTVNNRNTNSNVILVRGDLTIAANSTLTNVHATIPGTGFEVRGNYLTIHGTLNLSGGGSASVGQLILSPFSIPALKFGEGMAGNDFQVNRLEVNNPEDFNWSDLSVVVHHHLNLTDGVLNLLGASQFVHLTTDATTDPGFHTSPTQKSFINGMVRKTYLPDNSDFIFPVGDKIGSDYFYQPAAMNPGSSASTGEYEVKYFKENYNTSAGYPINTGALTYDGNWFYDPPIAGGNCIDEVSRCDYWMIEGTAPTTMALSWNTAYGCTVIDSPSNLRIAHFDTATELWENPFSCALTNGYLTIPEAPTRGWVHTLYPVSNFSPFTLAQVDPGTNALPIQLLSFSAEEKGTAVETEWITASEIDNDFFTVERSLNAIDFEAVGYLPGAGNSTSVRDYAFEDPSPYRGLSYYRLKQTDFNGDFSYSQIEAVEFGIDNAFDIVTTYSQDDRMTVEYHASASELDLKVYDLLGQMVHQQQFTDQNGRAYINADLPNGVYLIVLSDGLRQVQRKVFW